MWGFAFSLDPRAWRIGKCDAKEDDDLGFVVVFDPAAPTRQRLMTGEVTVTFPELD
ncbi:MAG: hypothetical protein GYB50_03820 [Rhodobacteraceae bacterium]|nr:hypothetical protein [Paracoccaceae bacterium]